MKFSRRKYLHELKRSLRNQITYSNRKEFQHTRQRLCRSCWKAVWTFGPKNFDLHNHQIRTLSTSACRRPLSKSLTRYSTAHRWVQGSYEQRVAVDKKKLCQESMYELPTSIRKCYDRQLWPHWILWCLLVLIYGYVTKVVLSSLQITVQYVLEVYKLKLSRTFAKASE